MTTSRAVLRGHWRCHRIRVGHVSSTRLVDPVVEAAVDREWARQRQLADQRGQTLDDAPSYRLESIRPVGEALDVSLALQPYRIHSAMKTLHRDPRVSAGHLDRSLIVDALVRTEDDHYVLLRSSKVLGPELQLVGGTATPRRRSIDTGSDLAEFARDHVTAALGATGDVDVVGVLGVVEQAIGCVCLVLDVRVASTVGCLSPRPTSEVVAVPATQLVEFLRSAPGYLPAVADLL